uniref:RING-type E3 ubiquitin transferase n=1 Tax=Macrostomum lignano TaxID=282301 RepID=A0A1I8J8S1_9PLAT
MDERSKGQQSMDERSKGQQSMDERSKGQQSMDERSKGQQSMDERSKGPQSMDEQRRDPQSMDQRKDEQPTRNTQNPIISSKYHQLTCEHPSKSWSDRRNSNELNLRGSRSQISEQEPYCSQEDRPGERSRSAAKRQLQNEIQRRFPEEKIFPMKVRFHILNESFSFNPENDKVIIVFSHEKLGGGSAAHSPFEIDSTCMALSQWKDSQEKVHKLTEVCYEFFLPQSAFSGKWNAEYEYSVKRKRANGHSYVEESLLHSDSRHQKAGISKRVVSDFTIKFDGIVSGNNLAPVFEKDQHSSEYYRMMLEQLTKCAVRELSERTLSPTTVVPEFEWAMHRLEDSEISTATSIKEQTVRSFVEQVMAAPSKHGFLTTAQKSTEDWKNSLELLRLCVERGGCFSTQMRLLGLRQDRAAQLLQGLLPPLDYASENNGKATRRHDRALKNLFNYVMTTESFFFELLFAIPAYHLLVLKVDPADSDLRRYKFEESRFPQFCGFEENRQVGFFKKNRYDYGRVEHFLAEYSKVDPLLCRFFAAIAHFDYINDFLTLRNVPALVKLATLQSLTSDSKKLKAVSEAAPSVIGSLQESPSGLTDFELKQCLLITRSMRNRVLSVDNVELYLQLVDCMLSCELENLRRGDKKKKEDIKELNESLEKLEESFRARKSSPQPFGYETLESLIRNFNNSFRQINQSDCTENLSKCLQKYFTRLLQYFEKETLLNFFNTSSTFGIMQPCATICLLNSLLETPKKHLENSGSLKTAFEKLFEQSKRTPQIYSVLSGVVCDTAKSFRSSNSNDNDRIDFLPELKFLIEWPIAACLLDF